MLAALVAHRRTIDMRTKRLLITVGVLLVVADAVDEGRGARARHRR